MRRLLRTVLLVVLLVVAVGCGGGGTESITTYEPGVTVRFPRGNHMKTVERSADDVHTWKSPDLEYVLDHGRLSVNGKRYGTVRKGDQVLIEGGRVTVNGEERKPEDGP